MALWYRANKMSGKIYAVPFDENDLEFQLDDIDTFVRQGEPVLICDDLEAAAEIFDIKPADIIVADE